MSSDRMSSSDKLKVLILVRLASMRAKTASMPSLMGILPYKLQTSMLKMMLLGGSLLGKSSARCASLRTLSHRSAV